MRDMTNPESPKLLSASIFPFKPGNSGSLAELGKASGGVSCGACLADGSEAGQ